MAPQARLDMIIAIIKDSPLITREEIAKVLGVGHTTIQNDLRILKEQYGLRYEGSSKTGQWVIGGKFVALTFVLCIDMVLLANTWAKKR